MIKKFLAAFVFLYALIVADVDAQGIRIGVKGAFNSTWLFNSNIFDNQDEIDYVSTFGPAAGISSTIYFNEDMGVSIDALYTRNAQIYKGTLSTGNYEATEKISYLDVPVLFRYSSEGGPYVEIGPQLGLLMGAKEDLSNTTAGINLNDKDFKSDFNMINIAAVIGFGYDIEAGDNMFVNIGLRFGYGINDVTKRFDEPDFATSDHSILSHYAHYDALGKFNYHQTNRAFGGLMVGLVFKL